MLLFCFETIRTSKFKIRLFFYSKMPFNVWIEWLYGLHTSFEWIFILWINSCGPPTFFFSLVLSIKFFFLLPFMEYKLSSFNIYPLYLKPSKLRNKTQNLYPKFSKLSDGATLCFTHYLSKFNFNIKFYKLFGATKKKYLTAKLDSTHQQTS